MNLICDYKIGEIPHQEYPRPQFRRDSYYCLNGIWRFAVRKVGAPLGNYDKQIVVPFSPETFNSGIENFKTVTPSDRLYYGRDFNIEKGWLRNDTLLHFGAVDYSCDVYVNGKLVGSHEGGYTSFVFDISEFISEGNNLLDVVVSDPTEESQGGRGKQKNERGGIWYTAQSGIWQTVWLENVPKKRIEDLTITCDIKKKEVYLDIVFDGIKNYKVFDGKKLIISGSSNGSIVLKHDFTLWSPEKPKLYNLLLECGDDRVYSYFGVRSFGIITDANGVRRLSLNGKPYYFSGLLDQGYWPDGLLTPPSDAAMINDLKCVKRMGFNTVRKHIKIENMRWYYHCDRMGIIVWQDFVNGGGEYQFTHIALSPFLGFKHNDSDYRYFGREDEKGRRRFTAEWQETIGMLKNCTCISTWTIFNEGWGQFDSEKIAYAVKQTDPTRIVESVSGWHDYKNKCDLKSMHIYYTKLKVPHDARPVVLSEFGGYSYRSAGHVFDEKKFFGYKKFKSGEKYITAIKKLFINKVAPLIKKGLCASIYTQLSDVEDELNGLITYDRKKVKVAPTVMYALNSELYTRFNEAISPREIRKKK